MYTMDLRSHELQTTVIIGAVWLMEPHVIKWECSLLFTATRAMKFLNVV